MASSFELAGAQSTCKPLCAVKILLHFQYLWYKPEAGDMYRLIILKTNILVTLSIPVPYPRAILIPNARVAIALAKRQPE